jgi:hypothetical protein
MEGYFFVVFLFFIILQDKLFWMQITLLKNTSRGDEKAPAHR